MCPFDEEDPPGNDPVQMECLGVTGAYTGGYSFLQDGAIFNWPANKSVQFNGTTAAQGTPTPSATNNRSNHWTLEIWARPAASGKSQVVISADYNWALRTTPSGFACDQQSKSSNPIQTATGGPTPQAGEWYQIACSENNDTLKLYVNGVLVGTDVTHQTGVSKTGKVRFGSRVSDWGYGDNFIGRMDEFSFFRSTLSADRIAEHYAAAGH